MTNGGALSAAFFWPHSIIEKIDDSQRYYPFFKL